MDAPDVPGPKVGSGKNAVPVLAAVGIPAVLYIGYRWWKYKRSGGTSIVNGQPTTDPAALSGAEGGISSGTDPSGLLTVGSGGIAPGSISGVGTRPFGSGLTLDAWGQAAENYLIGTGVSPLDAISAVNSYEGGQSLAPSAMSLIDQALANLGAPPGAPTGVQLTSPSNTPPTETTPIPVSSVASPAPALAPTPVAVAPAPAPAPAPATFAETAASNLTASGTPYTSTPVTAPGETGTQVTTPYGSFEYVTY